MLSKPQIYFTWEGRALEAEDFSGDYYEYKPASIFHWSSRVPEFYKSCQPLLYYTDGHYPADPCAGKSSGRTIVWPEHRVREASVGLVGSLKVGYIKGYERSSLSDRLRSFHNKYPNILISCYRWDTGVLETGLQKGDYDIIFTY